MPVSLFHLGGRSPRRLYLDESGTLGFAGELFTMAMVLVDDLQALETSIAKHRVTQSELKASQMKTSQKLALAHKLIEENVLGVFLARLDPLAAQVSERKLDKELLYDSMVAQALSYYLERGDLVRNEAYRLSMDMRGGMRESDEDLVGESVGNVLMHRPDPLVEGIEVRFLDSRYSAGVQAADLFSNIYRTALTSRDTACQGFLRKYMEEGIVHAGFTFGLRQLADQMTQIAADLRARVEQEERAAGVSLDQAFPGSVETDTGATRTNDALFAGDTTDDGRGTSRSARRRRSRSSRKDRDAASSQPGDAVGLEHIAGVAATNGSDVQRPTHATPPQATERPLAETGRQSDERLAAQIAEQVAEHAPEQVVEQGFTHTREQADKQSTDRSSQAETQEEPLQRPRKDVRPGRSSRARQAAGSRRSFRSPVTPVTDQHVNPTPQEQPATEDAPSSSGENRAPKPNDAKPVVAGIEAPEAPRQTAEDLDTRAPESTQAAPATADKAKDALDSTAPAETTSDAPAKQSPLKRRTTRSGGKASSKSTSPKESSAKKRSTKASAGKATSAADETPRAESETPHAASETPHATDEAPRAESEKQHATNEAPRAEDSSAPNTRQPVQDSAEPPAEVKGATTRKSPSKTRGGSSAASRKKTATSKRTPAKQVAAEEGAQDVASPTKTDADASPAMAVNDARDASAARPAHDGATTGAPESKAETSGAAPGANEAPAEAPASGKPARKRATRTHRKQASE